MESFSLDLLCLEQTSSVFVLHVEEVELAKIALSCHFALDLPCYKEGAYDSALRYIGHHCPWSIYCGSAPLPPDVPRDIVKALVDCLAITIFLAVTTTTVIGAA